jgi:DNA-binding beta-propeller fold protein YncE
MKTWCWIATVGLAFLIGCDRPPPPGEPLKILGRPGFRSGEFNYPRAAVYANDRYYVVDKSARVQAFTPAGEFVLQWSTPEWKAGKPVGLGAGPNGRIYVGDTHYSRVLVYGPDGEALGSFGSTGTGPGQFQLVTDIVVDRDGFIYVGEYGGNDRINKFTPDFEFVDSFAQQGPARLGRPQGLALGPDDRLYVADAANHRIAIFSRDGALVDAIGRLGDGIGELRFPYGVAFLSDGTLVVAEQGNNRVQRFTSSGESLGIWGRPGRAPGELAAPWGVAVGPNDELLIVDALNNRLQFIAGTDPANWRLPTKTTED